MVAGASMKVDGIAAEAADYPCALPHASDMPDAFVIKSTDKSACEFSLGAFKPELLQLAAGKDTHAVP